MCDFREPGNYTLSANVVQEYVKYYYSLNTGFKQTSITVTPEQFKPEAARYDALLNSHGAGLPARRGARQLPGAHPQPALDLPRASSSIALHGRASLPTGARAGRCQS